MHKHACELLIYYALYRFFWPKNNYRPSNRVGRIANQYTLCRFSRKRRQRKRREEEEEVPDVAAVHEPGPELPVTGLVTDTIAPVPKHDDVASALATLALDGPLVFSLGAPTHKEHESQARKRRVRHHSAPCGQGLPYCPSLVRLDAFVLSLLVLICSLTLCSPQVTMRTSSRSLLPAVPPKRSRLVSSGAAASPPLAE